MSPHPQTVSAGIEKLCSGNILVAEISPDMRLPVGGHIGDRENLSIYLEVDLCGIRDFLGKSMDRYESYTLDALASWLQAQNSIIDPKLFAACHALTVCYRSDFGGEHAGHELREKLYRDAAGTVQLSAILVSGSAECAEIAALGQSFLQKAGFKSSYMGGALLHSRAHEFSEEHSYVVIAHTDSIYVFDVANPIETTNGPMPALFKMPSDFLENMRMARRNCFVSGRDVLVNTERLFGVTHGANVLPTDILS